MKSGFKRFQSNGCILMLAMALQACSGDNASTKETEAGAEAVDGGGKTDTPRLSDAASDGGLTTGSSAALDGGQDTTTTGRAGDEDGGATNGATDDAGSAQVIGEQRSDTIGPTGGSVVLTGATVTIPAGGLEEETEIKVTVVTPDEDVPEAVREVTGVEIELGGQVLKVPALVELVLPVGSTAEQVFVVANTETRAFEVPASIQRRPDGSVVATFSVVESGRYSVVSIVLPDGCDKIQASPGLVGGGAEELEQLAGITRVTGPLTLSGSDVDSLESLECLVRIDGALTLTGTNLKDLEGLRNLAFVGGAVRIDKNTSLKDAKLPSLIAARGGLEVTQNTNLEVFDADSLGMVQGVFAFVRNGRAGGKTTLSMDGLKTVEGPFVLDSNPGLVNLDGVGGLTSVGGLIVFGNSDLESVTGLKRLVRVNPYATATSYYVPGANIYVRSGGVLVRKNDVLQELTSLEKLESVSGTIEINTNKELSRVALPALVSVSGALGVIGNVALTSYEADLLETVEGELYFHANGEAATLTTMSMANLVEVKGNVGIVGNRALADVSGFQELTTVGGRLAIINNQSLKNVDGFAALHSVGSLVVDTLQVSAPYGSGLNVTGNAALEDLTGFSALEDVGGDVNIATNAALTRAEFPSLTSVGKAFVVSGNPLLEGVVANELEAVPGQFTFDSNGSEGVNTSFSFENLTSIGDAASVLQNATLSGTGGWPRLTTIVGGLTIQNNAGLLALFGAGELVETGALSLSSNPLLQQVELPSLIQVNGTLSVTQHAALSAVTLPLLEEIRGLFSLTNNAALSTVSIPLLHRLDGGLSIGSNAALYTVAMDSIDVIASLDIRNNGSLVTSTSLSFSALATVSGNFVIASNTSVNSLLGFPVLNSVTGSFSVTANPILPTCGAIALRDQIEAGAGISGQDFISGNAVDLCSEP